jgi:holo-[acyl-carrier protein] synthase
VKAVGFIIRIIDMIVGFGLDLVEIQKISKSIINDHFRRIVFTPAEIEECMERENNSECFAGKFAAKEALMKAIGQGIHQEVWFLQIEVLHHASGEPYITVYRRAKEVLEETGANNIHVSITHTAGMAAAAVILEK